MSSRIVVEALVLVTWWGLSGRRRPGARRGRSFGREPDHPPRRPRRLLRLGGGPRQPRPGRPARPRRGYRAPGGGGGRLPTRPPFRRPTRPCPWAGPPAVPRGRRPPPVSTSTRPRARGAGDPRRLHAGHRADRPRRGLLDVTGSTFRPSRRPYRGDPRPPGFGGSRRPYRGDTPVPGRPPRHRAPRSEPPSGPSAVRDRPERPRSGWPTASGHSGGPGPWAWPSGRRNGGPRRRRPPPPPGPVPPTRTGRPARAGLSRTSTEA